MNAAVHPQVIHDVIIVGAGISGIGFAAHLAQKCPQLSYTILERRPAIGGTWDLFRYPGIRSDSDMYTLGFAFEPWKHERAIAKGETILDYLNQIVDERGIRENIQLSRQVVAADWESATALWTVTTQDEAGHTRTQRGHFIYMGSGYYDYDSPHDPQIPGIADFAGTVIHPQFWPQDFDAKAKRVVVIGSGATAATLVPALAEQGAQVTMLQRTPSYYLSVPAVDAVAHRLRRWLPEMLAYRLIRAKNIAMQRFLFRRARSQPEKVREFLTNGAREAVGPGFDATAFDPPYNPWQQRLCLMPDGDLFAAVRSGEAKIVTGKIAQVQADGILLESGERIGADAIVTATGLRMATLGKAVVRVDGEEIDFAQSFYYRNCLFSNVPNFAALFGYLNASWTLRVDIVSDFLCRLLAQMDAWKVDVVTPVLAADHDLIEDNVWDYTSGYIERGRHLIPKSATTEPWRISMDYMADRRRMRQAPLDDGVLKYERVRARVE